MKQHNRLLIHNIFSDQIYDLIFQFYKKEDDWWRERENWYHT